MITGIFLKLWLLLFGSFLQANEIEGDPLEGRDGFFYNRNHIQVLKHKFSDEDLQNLSMLAQEENTKKLLVAIATLRNETSEFLKSLPHNIEEMAQQYQEEPSQLSDAQKLEVTEAQQKSEEISQKIKTNLKAFRRSNYYRNFYNFLQKVPGEELVNLSISIEYVDGTREYFYFPGTMAELPLAEIMKDNRNERKSYLIKMINELAARLGEDLCGLVPRIA